VILGLALFGVIVLALGSLLMARILRWVELPRTEHLGFGID